MSRILIVDDHSGMTTILKEIFLELNYDVLTAPYVAAALELLAEHAVDLLITDMVMPDPDGTDADGLKLISTGRSRSSKLKVIAISGGGDPYGDGEAYLEAAKAMGADRCLVKPFKVKELVALVKEVMGDAA